MGFSGFVSTDLTLSLCEVETDSAARLLCSHHSTSPSPRPEDELPYDDDETLASPESPAPAVTTSHCIDKAHSNPIPTQPSRVLPLIRTRQAQTEGRAGGSQTLRASALSFLLSMRLILHAKSKAR